MGTGTYATQCNRYFGESVNVKGVEIDQKITDLARQYFELPDSVEVITYDGRAYLQGLSAGGKDGSEIKYDVIMVDAYQDITIPFQMSSVEFFNLVKDHLKENGIMVMNMNMHGNGETDITTYLSDTVASVFPNVATVNVVGSTNRELFASVNADLFKALEYNADFSEDDGLRFQLGKVMDGMIPYESTGLILTDDKAPVELLGMEVIDTLINDEIGYYKEIYQNEGLSGLIENL